MRAQEVSLIGVEKVTLLDTTRINCLGLLVLLSRKDTLR